MVMSYEILFAREKNQLSAVTIPARPGISDINRVTFFTRLADFLFNTNIPLRASERFFKQISFHAKFTSVTASEVRKSQVFVSNDQSVFTA